MKIGILVYSQTGNTLSVAGKLRDRLASLGHEASLERLTPVLANPRDPLSFRYDSPPGISGYEALALAAPVQGFRLCAAMSKFLPLLPDLAGRKVACFVTKQLKSAWTGGSKALATMAAAVEAKGGKVAGTGYVCWKSPQRDANIEALVEQLARTLG